jgi:hypothetical protein
MAVLLAPRSSIKTIALDIFIDYPHTYTTDEFTPSSFVFQNSVLAEEQLHIVDMLPKMVDNLILKNALAIPHYNDKQLHVGKNVSHIYFDANCNKDE